MHRPCHSCREPSLKGCFWHAVVTEGPFLPRPVTEAVFLPRRRHWKALFASLKGPFWQGHVFMACFAASVMKILPIRTLQ